MSSFVVSPATMNRILSFLDDTMAGNSINKWGIEDVLTRYMILPAGRNPTLDEKTLQKLSKSLWDLNIEAVYQRYGDESVNKMPGSYENQRLVHHSPHVYTPTTAIQAYKSLQCLTYQCAEGDVPNNPLYKMLEELEATVARQIVHNLPEYDKAEWD